MIRSVIFNIWLTVGMRAGWVSRPYCMTHEGNYEYMNEEERKEWDEGNDPCHTGVSVLIFNQL